MKSLISGVLATLFAVLAVAANGQTQDCGSCSQDRGYLVSGPFPFVEDIEYDATTSTVVLDNTWAKISDGCDALAGTGIRGLAANGSEIPVNALLRAYLQLYNNQQNVNYEIRFVLRDRASGQVVSYPGWYVRTTKGALREGEWFNGSMQNVGLNSAGAVDWVLELEGRVIDAGKTVTISLHFLTAQGAPSDGKSPDVVARYPSGKAVDSSQFNITGSWQSTTAPTIHFSNSVSTDIFVQGYLEFNGGTPGDKISLGVQLDNEPSSRRTIDVYVPETYGRSNPRTGFNFNDYLEDVPPGSHTLKLWSINRNGSTTPISNRQLEFASFPVHSGAPVMSTAYGSGPTTVRSLYDADNAEPHPNNTLLNSDSGYWTLLAETAIPPVAGELNWVGAGYVELLGRSADDTGTWTTGRAEIAIEVLNHSAGNPVVDMHFTLVDVSKDRRGQISFFIDAMRWGTPDGSTARLWIRKVVTDNSGTGDFDVGKRFFGIKLVPFSDGSDEAVCYYHPNSGS